MKILHVTPYYTPAYTFGGVVRSVEGMTRALARHGHQVTVLTTDALNHSQRYDGALEENIQGVQVTRIPNISTRLRSRANLSTPRAMRQAALRLIPDVDVIHVHEFRTMENLLVTPVAVQFKKPLILSPHGTLDLTTGRSILKTAWDRLLSPSVAQRVDHLIGLTLQEVETAQSLWPSFGCRQFPTQFSVIPNGIDPNDYTNLLGRESFRARHHLGEHPVCLFMGRLHPRKGVEVLARAFIEAGISDARLVIAGPDEGVLSAISPLLNEQMIVTGYLSGEDRLAALAAADIFALPAIGEGLPMAVLEAMGAGLPAIVSPGCNLPQIAEFQAGLEVEPQVEPLAEALRQLLTDSPLRQQMGKAARQLVNQHFTWDAIALQLEQVYQNVMP
jgi:glycosyltransferase involved in cell wall biosynthesis